MKRKKLKTTFKESPVKNPEKKPTMEIFQNAAEGGVRNVITGKKYSMAQFEKLKTSRRSRNIGIIVNP
jgi:hypothetical protein